MVRRIEEVQGCLLRMHAAGEGLLAVLHEPLLFALSLLELPVGVLARVALLDFARQSVLLLEPRISDRWVRILAELVSLSELLVEIVQLRRGRLSLRRLLRYRLHLLVAC